MMPPAPRATCLTCEELGSIVRTNPTCSATSLAVAAARAPSAVNSATAVVLMSHTTSSCPAARRFFAMGLPMMPSPTNPIFTTLPCLARRLSPAAQPAQLELDPVGGTLPGPQDRQVPVRPRLRTPTPAQAVGRLQAQHVRTRGEHPPLGQDRQLCQIVCGELASIGLVRRASIRAGSAPTAEQPRLMRG